MPSQVIHRAKLQKNVLDFRTLSIMLVVFAFNMFGDGLRKALDPRLRGLLYRFYRSLTPPRGGGDGPRSPHVSPVDFKIHACPGMFGATEK